MITETISPERRLDSLDEFEIGEVIDRGGFGEVRKGYIKSTGQEIVIKKNRRNDPAYINALIKEYNLLLKCSHPGIQIVIGFYHPEDSDLYYLISPYFPKGSLYSFMRKEEDFQEKMVLKYIITLGTAYALKYLHKNNIAHRDLKPENILINEFLEPVITDFGISRENIANMQTLTGTIFYVAPEILVEYPNYNEKADVYSFGLVVNEIYTGEIPYDGLGKNEIIRKKRNEDFIVSSSIPNNIKKIIQKCVSRNADERPSFKEVFQKLKEKSSNQPGFDKIAQYIRKMKYQKQQKRIFRIPQQIIKLPANDEDWNIDNVDLINWEVFNNTFNIDDQKKTVLIMTFGNHEIGKSTFLRTVTGNQAYISGKGGESTTKGIYIDGPYTKSYIVDNIVNDDFKEKINSFHIPDDVDIFFLDTQGIGDENLDHQKNYSILYNRLLSVFSSISNICITIPNFNIEHSSLERWFKLVRRTQLMTSYKFSKVVLLVRNCQDYNQMADLNLNSILRFHSTFYRDFINLYKNTSNYYTISDLVPIPMGDCGSSYESYLFSVWYTTTFMFSQISEEELVPKSDIYKDLLLISTLLFGEGFRSMTSDICALRKEYEYIDNSFPENQIQVANIIKSYYASFRYALSLINYLLFKSDTLPKTKEDILQSIEQCVKYVRSYLFPFLISDYNINIKDYIQYSNELNEDLLSYVNVHKADWLIKIRDLINFRKSTVPVIAAASVIGVALIFVPVIGQILGPVFSISTSVIFSASRIGVSMSCKQNESFETSIYPFIWNKSLSKTKMKNYDMQCCKQIGGKESQLIVFYEQEGNDSTLIFRALTGLDVDFSTIETASFVFTDISIQSLMERFNRFEKVHTTIFQEQEKIKKLNFLYLKGYSQEKILLLSNSQKRPPIFVSSFKKDQNFSIIPDEKCPLKVFYINENCYDYLIASEKNYLQTLGSFDEIKSKINIDNLSILPITSSDFNFDIAGPRVEVQIRLGCRYILQDESLQES